MNVILLRSILQVTLTQTMIKTEQMALATGSALKQTGEQARSKTVHHLNFEAHGGSERWRLMSRFIGLAFGVLCTGKAQLCFKDRR